MLFYLLFVFKRVLYYCHRVSTQLQFNTRADTKKNESNPIAREPRVGGEIQTDSYRTCSDLSQCYKAQLDRFTQYKWTHLQIGYKRLLILDRKMSDCKCEQGVNIRFLVKLKKSAMETFQLLTEALGEGCMSLARVFEWHKRFSEGRESLKDDDRPDRLRTAVTDDNIEKVRDVIRKDRRLGVRAVAEEVNLDRESVRRILMEELNMRKLCAKMVPKSAVRRTKRTSQGIVFGPFATH